jgi:adenylyltransferase/sulfurtransferase
MTMPLDEIARRLGRTMTVTRKGEILSLGVGPEEILLFPDGRAIVKGTSDKTRARTLYDKYVGG